MEKKAVVEAGVTPSEESGRKSDMVKNGKALAYGERDTVTEAEERLADKMSGLYNQSRQNELR